MISKNKIVDQVTVKLNEFIIHGSSTLIVRLRSDDREDVTKAARALGMTQAQFTRSVLIQAARIVVAEHGV